MKEYDINLSLPDKGGKKIPRLILAPTFIIFALTFLIAVIIVSYSFLLKLNSSTLSANVQNLREQISSHAVKKDKLLVTAERLDSIRKIIATRGKLDATILYILSKIPDSFSVESISGGNTEISLSVSSPNLSEFATLLSEKLPDAASNKSSGIESIKIDTFVQSEDGYSLSLVINLKNKK